MFNKIITIVFLVSSFITLTISCSSSSDNLHEKKSDSLLEGNQDLVKKQIMSETTYKVTVDLDKSSFLNHLQGLPVLSDIISKILKTPNANACEGSSKLILYDDYSQKLEGKLKCLGLIDIDLADAMAKDELERIKEDMSKYPYYGSILRENNPVITNKRIPEGTAYFKPPRPLLINPMVSGDKLPKKMSENSTMVFINSKKEQVKTTGTFTIEVKDPKADIPEGVDPSYINGDIVHIDIQSSGFKGVDKDRSKYLLFQSREMFISLTPIIITKMVIHSSAKDLININSNIISSLVGDITIDFVMTKHEMK